MFGLLTGAWHSRALHTAAQLKIADVIGDGEKTLAELVTALGTNSDFTFRLLRGLLTLGFFEENNGRYKNSALSNAIRSTGSMYAAVVMLGMPCHSLAWMSMSQAVKTGQSASRCAFGETCWDYMAKHPDDFSMFNAAMVSFSSVTVPALLPLFEWSKFQKIIDVGGGHGGFLKHLLPIHTKASYSIAELESVCKDAPTAAPDLQGKITWISADFFKTVPAGGDLYILKHIIHDWSDAHCTTILKNIHQAMDKKGRVVVVDSVMPEKVDANLPPQDKRVPFMDLNMMCMCEGGRERTEKEFSALAKSCGFSIEKILRGPPHIQPALIVLAPDA